MRFLVDNALSPKVAVELASAGHDAVHVRDRGMSAASDQQILDLAVAEDRIVVTSDTDFGTILATSGRDRPSVMQLRGRIPNDPADQAELLLHHLQSLEGDLLAGALVTFAPSRIRIRPLPMI